MGTRNEKGGRDGDGKDFPILDPPRRHLRVNPKMNIVTYIKFEIFVGRIIIKGWVGLLAD